MGIRDKIDRFLGWTLVVIMSLMVVNVLWQVFSRFVLGDPSSYTEELARYLMIWVGVLGAAYVSGKNKHVAIDYFPTKFSEKNQIKVKVFVKPFNKHLDFNLIIFRQNFLKKIKLKSRCLLNGL